MRNLTKLAENYFNKIADYSNYRQILNVKKAFEELKQNVQEENAKNVANSLLSKAAVLARLVYNYGITASVSTKYKAEIVEKLNELKLSSAHLSNINKALSKYVPTNISSIKLAQEVLPAGTPQTPHLAPTFEFPVSENELQTWPLLPNSPIVEPKKEEEKKESAPPVKEEAPPVETPKFNFHPKPGASGFIPGSDAPTFNVEPITTAAAIKYLKEKANKRSK